RTADAAAVQGAVLPVGASVVRRIRAGVPGAHVVERRLGVSQGRGRRPTGFDELCARGHTGAEWNADLLLLPRKEVARMSAHLAVDERQSPIHENTRSPVDIHRRRFGTGA